MKTGFSVWTTSLALCLAAVWLAPARAGTPEPEHTIWVKIESAPSAVELYSAPPGASNRVRIGTTPCTIAVDLTWGLKWLKRNWEMISVWSPGNSCRAVAQPDKSFDLILTVNASKDGYTPATVELPVGRLSHPGPEWAGQAVWPTESRANIALSPVAGEAPRRVAAAKPHAVKKVVYAGEGASERADAGTLTIMANADDARVFINDQPVGTAPVQAVLQPGVYSVRLARQGYRPLTKEIHVDADTEVIYRAVLVP